MALPPPAPDSTCLVTGASAGIGAEIARALARRGRGVTIVARRRERLEALAGELTARHGIRAEALPCDLTDAGARAALLDDVAARGLRVDVLVNDAGFAPDGRVEEADPETELRVVRLNVEPVVDLTTRCAPGMVARGAGGILNLASTAAFIPTPNQASYGASKAFVLSYTDAIGAELKGTGVHVTALCPGPVPTEIFDASTRSGIHPVDRMPKLLWHEPAELAEAGVAGLEQNKPRVFVGLPNALGSHLAQVLPRTRIGLAAFGKVFTKPGRPNAARR